MPPARQRSHGAGRGREGSGHSPLWDRSQTDCTDNCIIFVFAQSYMLARSSLLWEETEEDAQQGLGRERNQ